MMNLESVMTKEEQAAVEKLIVANLSVEAAQMRLWEALQRQGEAAKELTTIYYLERRSMSREGCRIPEIFVTFYGGKPYLINIDTEGDHCHRVDLIGGVLGRSPNGN